MKAGPLFAWFALVWSVIILAKVISVLLRREPYKFTFWDGGMMLNGKVMGRGATYAFGLFVGTLCAVSIWLVHAWSKL